MVFGSAYIGMGWTLKVEGLGYLDSLDFEEKKMWTSRLRFMPNLVYCRDMLLISSEHCIVCMFNRGLCLTLCWGYLGEFATAQHIQRHVE